MKRMRIHSFHSRCIAGALGALLIGCTATSPSPEGVSAPTKQAPAAQAVPTATAGVENVVLCDGQRTVALPADMRGEERAGALLDQWRRDHPDRDWVMEQKEKHSIPPPADNSAIVAVGQAEGHPYGNFTARDVALWARETEKFVAEGSRIFHDGDLLGSTVAVSCDMCHPNAANTHPETYPKFQSQLGKGALLRDMINWCIENPVRGKKLDADDPRMRALEAYIAASRTGTKMEYGKH